MGVGSTDATDSMRFALSTYTTDAEVAECPECSCGSTSLGINAGTTECGKFTGSRAQLEADLAWHRENHDPTSSCNPSLQSLMDFASNLFVESGPSRTKVLVILGKGNADVGVVAVRDALAAIGVKVFAVQVTKNAVPSVLDNDMAGKMQASLVTAPSHLHAGNDRPRWACVRSSSSSAVLLDLLDRW